MEIEILVKRYLDAWNRQDVDGVLALMHEGAAYYDAFWRESCVGRDLIRYLNDAFVDYTYLFRQIGTTIVTDSGAVLRYGAFDSGDPNSDESIFNGVEVLTIRDGKILTVSNHYCDPRRSSVLELAELEAARHGESRYAKSGLASKRLLKIKHTLCDLMHKDKLFLNPLLTPAQLADQIGCSIDHLLQVMNVERRSDFQDCLNRHRIEYARDHLMEELDDNNDLSDVAVQAGFASIDDFNAAFKKLSGGGPEEFRQTPIRLRSGAITP